MRSFLKPLDQAVRDGNIYGVIKSAVVNHGSCGIRTVPNPKHNSVKT